MRPGKKSVVTRLAGPLALLEDGTIAPSACSSSSRSRSWPPECASCTRALGGDPLRLAGDSQRRMSLDPERSTRLVSKRDILVVRVVQRQAQRARAPRHLTRPAALYGTGLSFYRPTPLSSPIILKPGPCHKSKTWYLVPATFFFIMIYLSFYHSREYYFRVAVGVSFDPARPLILFLDSKCIIHCRQLRV